MRSAGTTIARRGHLPARAGDDAVVAGVCAGLAPAFGVDAIVLRIAFLALAAAGGTGLALYAIAAIAMPSPRRGEAARAPRRRRIPGWRETAGVGLLVLSLLLALRALGLWFSDIVVWPVVLTASGLTLLWRQSTIRLQGFGSRTLIGIALIVGGGAAFLSATDSIGGLRHIVVAAGVVFVGTVLVFGPWWLRLSQALTAERTMRIVSQERAEVAAHLHDSVLQTLALIQRHASDPRSVAQLARRQERELRAWLNDERPDGAATSLNAALRDAAAEIETLHHVPVEVVVVGDRALDEPTTAVVAAAREAMANAARFSGADRVDVYAEAGEQRTEVYVRDRGAGFDRAAVPDDRRGLRESIEGRMARHGGSATIVSAPGAGTEVELVLEVSR
ncbi:MAG TPA: PspC domain-containing protein [Solirubrobacteraceae bacterium]|nr:PspC domain-containing protein [Solirubrobacteraceae bacterium]